MDAVPEHTAIGECCFGRIHHWSRPANEPSVDSRNVFDQMFDGLVAGFAVEHSVEKIDVARFVAEEVIKLEPTQVAVLERCQRLKEDNRTGVAIAVE